MCCCDCLLVEALIQAEKADQKPTEGRTLGQTDVYENTPLGASNRVPRHLCGWILLALKQRVALWREVGALGA